MLYAHGRENSISLYDGRLGKTQISDLLIASPSKKLVIVNSCHAAGVWENVNLPRTQFLLSSERYQLTYGSVFLTDVARFIRENIQRGKPVDFKTLSLAYALHTPVIPDHHTTTLC
ncbi:hypothetical protein HY988_05800 [Candidatus Micrarchaeota archaeon]|nr:hypothetical protein [Candidatus Micrarchaeota archaeon]